MSIAWNGKVINDDIWKAKINLSIKGVKNILLMIMGMLSK